MLNEDFKEGYRDGYGQAMVNVEDVLRKVESVLRKHIETHSTDYVEIMEMVKKCEVDKVDEDYLNQ